MDNQPPHQFPTESVDEWLKRKREFNNHQARIYQRKYRKKKQKTLPLTDEYHERLSYNSKGLSKDKARRVCLKCDKNFVSFNKYNRVCNACKGSSEFKDSTEY